MLRSNNIRSKPSVQILMIFAKQANYVAQILAEALVSQKVDEKDLSSWVISIIAERCQSIQTSFTDE